MAIAQPSKGPADSEGCREALQQGFDLLVTQAAWAGWCNKMVAEHLVRMAVSHKDVIDSDANSEPGASE